MSLLCLELLLNYVMHVKHSHLMTSGNFIYLIIWYLVSEMITQCVYAETSDENYMFQWKNYQEKCLEIKFLESPLTSLLSESQCTQVLSRGTLIVCTQGLCGQ